MAATTSTSNATKLETFRMIGSALLKCGSKRAI